MYRCAMVCIVFSYSSMKMGAYKITCSFQFEDSELAYDRKWCRTETLTIHSLYFREVESRSQV